MRFSHNPLANSLKQFEERQVKGTLKQRAEMEPILMKATAAHMMWELDKGIVPNVPVACVASSAAADVNDTVTNDTNTFYSNFYPDLSCVFMTAELVDSQPTASLIC